MESLQRYPPCIIVPSGQTSIPATLLNWTVFGMGRNITDKSGRQSQNFYLEDQVVVYIDNMINKFKARAQHF